MIYKNIFLTITTATCLLGGISFDHGLHAATKPIKNFETPIAQIDETSYDAFIATEGVVIVEFYLSQCGPCRKMKPIYLEIANELKGQASFGKILLSGNRPVGRANNIQKVPTFILYRNGVEVKRINSTTKENLKNWIQSEL